MGGEERRGDGDIAPPPVLALRGRGRDGVNLWRGRGLGLERSWVEDNRMRKIFLAECEQYICWAWGWGR